MPVIVMSFFQEVTPAGFLPDDLGEWLGALAIIVAAILGFWRQGVLHGRAVELHRGTIAELRAELKNGFISQGERLGRVEEGCSGLTQRVGTLESELRGLAFIANGNTQECGQLRGQLEQHVQVHRGDMALAMEERAKIRERLASMEAQILFLGGKAIP